MELDPEYMALYVAAAVLSTIGLVILFRESRARKKALEEERRPSRRKRNARSRSGKSGRNARRRRRGIEWI